MSTSILDDKTVWLVPVPKLTTRLRTNHVNQLKYVCVHRDISESGDIVVFVVDNLYGAYELPFYVRVIHFFTTVKIGVKHNKALYRFL